MWPELDVDGRFHTTLADSDDHLDLYPRLAQARGAMANSIHAHEHHPLLVAVLPDDDGVVRSRWRL
ncbi:hypothetical protein BBK82_19280 [Lentzea guizhouensis]|uniref:Uncharacterized protein n=1 Tax=Lentzea guizhouensis TaxID=1586287 RepID=A0A1B2HJJ0_9PSEU|nr:hypothetical protein [Lentzea guizhouensis]ANZ37883.1 hypothetical protein BBK82_19280 [Lentzea guizhouensis]